MADQRSPVVMFDLDSGGGFHGVQGVSLRLTASGGSIEAIGQMAMASSIPVVIASNQSAVLVDTELPTAAALGDALAANTSTSVIGSVGYVMNATTLDRQRAVVAALDSNGIGIAAAGMVGQLDDAATATVTENQFAPVRISPRRALLVEGVASGTNLNVNLAASAATVTVDTELPAAAAISAENTAAPTAPAVYAFGMVFDGTNWDRMAGTSAGGVSVTVQNTVTVDTELPAAAALTDAFANPTAPGVGAFLMGWNATTWDRVKTANTGRLQVDVITGGGATVPVNPVTSYQTSAAVAAGAVGVLTTAEAAAKKLRQVVIWASVAFKATLTTVDNAIESAVKGIGGGPAFVPCTIAPPASNYVTLGTTAGLDAFRVNVTNLDDLNAADVYAVFSYED